MPDHVHTIGNPRVRRPEDCPPYQLGFVVFHQCASVPLRGKKEKELNMEIKRSSSQSSGKSPADWCDSNRNFFSPVVSGRNLKNRNVDGCCMASDKHKKFIHETSADCLSAVQHYFDNFVGLWQRPKTGALRDFSAP
jgi:hypothetical protein